MRPSLGTLASCAWGAAATGIGGRGGGRGDGRPAGASGLSKAIQPTSATAENEAAADKA